MFKLNDNRHTQITWEASMSVQGQEISSLHIFSNSYLFTFTLRISLIKKPGGQLDQSQKEWEMGCFCRSCLNGFLLDSLSFIWMRLKAMLNLRIKYTLMNQHSFVAQQGGSSCMDGSQLPTLQEGNRGGEASTAASHKAPCVASAFTLNAKKSGHLLLT